MKKYFELIYWSVTTLLMALIFMSVMEDFGSAFFLSVMLMPGVLFVNYFGKDLSFKNRRLGILHAIYFGAAAMLIEYLAILLVYWILYGFSESPDSGVLLNPVFILFMLASLISIGRFIKSKFPAPEPEEKYITFTSQRMKASIRVDSILYIESKDYEVMVRTASGKTYPTRMKISQWEAVLDNRFLRVHRSFIINRDYLTEFDSNTLYLGEIPIELSRKYKDNVLAGLKDRTQEWIMK